jgi:hypothetical protein
LAFLFALVAVVQMEYSIRLLSRIDIISSIVGAFICIVFVLYESNNPERDTPFPWEQTFGMAFNALICPMLMYFNFDFYERWRNVIIIVLRISFIIGTTADYEDLPNQLFPWPSFVVNVLYFSRSLVISWGCFAWLLPKGRYHVLLQLMHSILALKLAPVTCALPSTEVDTFASLNMPKFRTWMNVLDWPFMTIPGASKTIMSDLSSDYVSCMSVCSWCSLVFGFMTPSLIFLMSYPGLSQRMRMLLHRDGLFILACASQALWCIMRISSVKFL